MPVRFGEALRKLRVERGLSQQQLGDALHVDRSTVAKWESGNRLPNATMLSILSNCLGADMAEILRLSLSPEDAPKVILVDDERIILTGGMKILQQAIPNAEITGFSLPSDALEFARQNRVALALLDIEMGRISGMELCRELLDIDSRINVVYLTAYRDYAFDAWETGACGFLLKPLTVDAVHRQLRRLRYPIPGVSGL